MKPILFNTEMVRAILEGRKTVTRRVIKGTSSRIHMFHFLNLETDPDICSVNRWGEEVPKTVKGLYAEFEADDSYPIEFPMFKSSYQVGDILYVRETWRPTVGRMHTMSRDRKRIVYTSDYHNGYEYKAHCFGISDFYFPDGFKECDSLDYDHMSEITSKGKWHPSIHMPKKAARIFLKVTDVRVERLQEITEEQAVKEGAIDNRGFIHSPDDEYDEIHTARGHFKKIWNSTINKQDFDHYDWDANPWVWVIEFERIEKEGEEK